MSKPSARELCEAIRTRGDTDAAIIGTNLAARVERVLAFHADAGDGYCVICQDYQGALEWPCQTMRLLNGEEP